jgi:hypothetical protein
MATYSTVKVDIDMLRRIIVEAGDHALKGAMLDNFGHLKYFNPWASLSSSNIQQGVSSDIQAVFDDIKAWIMFFGRGQGITHDNPFLKDYIENSGLWAEGRPHSGTIVRRGAGKYEQYNYKTGELETYEGTEPQGEALPTWYQAARRVNPEIDFWDLIEKTYNDFVSNFNYTAIPNINRRSDEYIKIDSKTI